MRYLIYDLESKFHSIEIITPDGLNEIVEYKDTLQNYYYYLISLEGKVITYKE